MIDDQSDALDAIRNMTAAFMDGDIEGVMASYEEDAAVVFEPGDCVTGLGSIRARFEQAFAMNPRFEYARHDVFVAGDVATHFAPWTMTGSAPDGTAISQSGLSVAVLRRQSEGGWKIVFDNPHGSALLQSA